MQTNDFTIGQTIKVTGGRFGKNIATATVNEIRPTTLRVGYRMKNETGGAIVRIDGRGAHVISE